MHMISSLGRRALKCRKVRGRRLRNARNWSLRKSTRIKVEEEGSRSFMMLPWFLSLLSGLLSVPLIACCMLLKYIVDGTGRVVNGRRSLRTFDKKPKETELEISNLPD